MKIKRYISLLLSILLVLSVTAAFPIGASADADSVANLSTYNQYFRRTMGSFARADMNNNNIMASLTVAQSIHESEWGRSYLATEGKNLFGIKAMINWKGLVISGHDNIICSNYDDYRILSGSKLRGSGWRAYSNWVDSIDNHSTFLNSDKYGEMVPVDKVYAATAEINAENQRKFDAGEVSELVVVQPYEVASKAVVAAGYCPDDGYAKKLIYYIEKYDLTEYDDISPNESGVVAIKMSDAEKALAINGTCTLTAQIYSYITVEQGLSWDSTNKDVATVSENGEVTAIAPGFTLITATIGDREACCIINVTSNGSIDNAVVYNVNQYLNLRSERSATSTFLGQFNLGQVITVTGSVVDEWYPVTGVITTGEVKSGWATSKCIRLLPSIEEPSTEATKVAIDRYELNRDINTSYQLQFAVGPAYAADKSLTWTSSDPTVANVDNGLITTLNYGRATITATTSNGLSTSCVVNVTTESVKYNAVVTYNLLVRDDDILGAKQYGTMDAGTYVTVIDNYSNADGIVGDDWYYAEGVMNDGTSVVGYLMSKYVVPISRVDVAPPITDIEFIGSTLAVNDGYIYGVSPSCTVADFLRNISNTNAYVYDKNDIQLTDTDLVTTGSRLYLIEGDTVTNSMGIVIKGDINGNGKIDAADYLYLKRYLLGTISLEGASLKAAFVSGESNISVTDYIMIKRQYLGTYTIIQNIFN